jgi:hypothetical protein
MANEAFFTVGGNYEAEEFRRLLGTFYKTPGNVSGAISGLAVVQGGGSTVKVQAGAGWFPDGSGGAYIGAFQVDSDVITIPAASGAARTDTIYVTISDPGTAPHQGEMLTGRAANTMTIPATSLALARVTANLDGSLTILDARIQCDSAAGDSSDTGWVSLAYLNSWSNGDATEGNPPLIRRRGKHVELIALVKEPSAGSRSNLGICVPFVIPAGFIPVYTRRKRHATSVADAEAQVNVYGTPSTTPGRVLVLAPATASRNSVWIYDTWFIG